MKTSVYLSDIDLATLIGSADPEVSSAARAAGDRLAAVTRWPGVPSCAAALIADVIAEAKREGRLIYRGVAASYCSYCDARSKWEKPKRRRREHEVKVSGIEFADRFIVISGHISVGGCRACVDQALASLKTELTAFPVELPAALRTDGAPTYQRWDLCRCKRCGWRGHDGQLGKLRTLMGDGYYPGKCPSCGAERRPLGPDPFERLDGFVVAESST